MTTANILIPQIRRPVATSSIPPTALKSAIIIGVVSGMISEAQAADHANDDGRLQPTKIVDMAATVCALLNIQMPNACIGTAILPVLESTKK